MEALTNQALWTPYIKILHKLYKNFTSKTKQNKKRNTRGNSESDDMGAKIDGRQLHHLRFADHIVFVAPNI
ncbi:hypothetical protein DICVIV_10253 [Dictyocaulus viviparus]|uniref:Uncharacterized protein n=1 Tax=Dictyocaulus viviparus TaxID=29172 RepID=A0A0D8XN02_DICVI|nr:hypothetical protein DICVIV_10253 [Dictyocaulus viviparus]